jgi:hypothetical protein
LVLAISGANLTPSMATPWWPFSDLRFSIADELLAARKSNRIVHEKTINAKSHADLHEVKAFSLKSRDIPHLSTPERFEDDKCGR